MAKILIIDDDVTILGLMTAILVKGGHEVTKAKGGVEGIQKLMFEQFDLVIIDIIMPELSGLEVMIWLNKQENKPKVIATSGGSDFLEKDTILRFIEKYHADKVLPKPFKFETLNQEVDDVLHLM